MTAIVAGLNRTRQRVGLSTAWAIESSRVFVPRLSAVSGAVCSLRRSRLSGPETMEPGPGSEGQLRDRARAVTAWSCCRFVARMEAAAPVSESFLCLPIRKNIFDVIRPKIICCQKYIYMLSAQKYDWNGRSARRGACPTFPVYAPPCASRSSLCLFRVIISNTIDINLAEIDTFRTVRDMARVTHTHGSTPHPTGSVYAALLRHCPGYESFQLYTLNVCTEKCVLSCIYYE